MGNAVAPSGLPVSSLSVAALCKACPKAEGQRINGLSAIKHFGRSASALQRKAAERSNRCFGGTVRSGSPTGQASGGRGYPCCRGLVVLGHQPGNIGPLRWGSIPEGLGDSPWCAVPRALAQPVPCAGRPWRKRWRVRRRRGSHAGCRGLRPRCLGGHGPESLLPPCRRECAYFGLCGGGAGSNKYWEHGTFACSETQACRYRIKITADVVLAGLEEALGLVS